MTGPSSSTSSPLTSLGPGPSPMGGGGGGRRARSVSFGTSSNVVHERATRFDPLTLAQLCKEKGRRGGNADFLLRVSNERRPCDEPAIGATNLV